MSVETEIVDWFSAKAGSTIQSFKEVQRGAEICIYLCDISDNPEEKKQIQPGSSYEERLSNYELAKTLIENLGLEFTYDLNKLARLDKAEFIRFAQEIMSLEEDDEPIQYENQTPNEENEGEVEVVDEEEEEEFYDQFDFDSLFAELVADLNKDMEQIHQLQEEINEHLEERNFYLNKLLDIEKICKSTRKNKNVKSQSILKILQLTSSDFEPPEPEE